MRRSAGPAQIPETGIALVAVVVRDYDEAIAFFVDVLGFELVEDSPATTNDGRPKRWVVVAPSGGSGASLLLAQADGPEQDARIGDQTGGRVSFFLNVDDFDTQYEHMKQHGVEFTQEPRRESYGTFVVFRDVAGNLWDLIEPAADPSTGRARAS